MIHPSTDSQEKRNAYTDWLLRQEDEYESAIETREETRRKQRRARRHAPSESPLIPGFCECGLNMTHPQHIQGAQQ